MSIRKFRSTPLRSTAFCSPMRTSIIPAICRCSTKMGSAARYMPPRPPPAFAASCCSTARTSRCLRRSGATARPSVQGSRDTSPYTIRRMRRGRSRSFIPCRYDQRTRVLENVEIRFVDVGHLLGSSSIEIWITEGDEQRKIVFSGDVGNRNQPIIRDPHTIPDADYVVIESTYGDRYHEQRPDYIGILTECLQKTFDRGGNVVIPAFAVGRTQEMLYFLRQIKEQGLVKGHDGLPRLCRQPACQRGHRRLFAMRSAPALTKKRPPSSAGGSTPSILTI